MALSTLLCSCNNMQVDDFAASKINSYKVKENLQQKVAIAHFSATADDIHDIPCRGTGVLPGDVTISLPNNETFVQYIENAFTETLIDADRYDPKSKQRLQGKITGGDFNSLVGNWRISGVFSLNKKHVAIEKKYAYPTALQGKLACENTAKAFKNVVANFVRDVIEEVA